MTSESVNISGDIISSARQEAELMNRPLKAQLERWARIGRAVESEAGFRKDQVDGALRGQLNPDELGRLVADRYDLLQKEAQERPRITVEGPIACALFIIF